jgi:hypothetical protein
MTSRPGRVGAVLVLTLGLLACSSSSDQTLLAWQLDSPRGIASDGTNVYWTAGGTSNVSTVVKCRGGGCFGMPTVLAQLPGRATDEITVDAKNAYWTTDSGQVMKCAVGGCNNNPTVLASNLQRLQGPAVDATSVYFISRTYDPSTFERTQQLMKCAVDGCDGQPTTIATNVGELGSADATTFDAGVKMVVDSTSVYWATDGGVMTCAVAACTPTLVASSIAGSVAVDAESVYWVTGGSPTSADGQVLKCAIAGCGGNPIVVASGLIMPRAIVVDATSVYWVAGWFDDAPPQVLKCPNTGCVGLPTVLVSAVPKFSSVDPQGLAVDATSLYWTNAPPGGQVGRVAK